MGDFPELRRITLANNTALDGDFPAGMANLDKVTTVLAAYTSLDNLIPIAGMSALQTIYAWNSDFSGPIPAGFANHPALANFQMSSNNFSG